MGSQNGRDLCMVSSDHVFITRVNVGKKDSTHFPNGPDVKRTTQKPWLFQAIWRNGSRPKLGKDDLLNIKIGRN